MPVLLWVHSPHPGPQTISSLRPRTLVLSPAFPQHPAQDQAPGRCGWMSVELNYLNKSQSLGTQGPDVHYSDPQGYSFVFRQCSCLSWAVTLRSFYLHFLWVPVTSALCRNQCAGDQGLGYRCSSYRFLQGRPSGIRELLSCLLCLMEELSSSPPSTTSTLRPAPPSPFSHLSVPANRLLFLSKSSTFYITPVCKNSS